MLDLVFGLMLATSGLTSPALDNSGLDRRRPETTQAAELAIRPAIPASPKDDRVPPEGPVLWGPANR